VERWIFLRKLYGSPNHRCGALLWQFCCPLKVDARENLLARSASIDSRYARRISGPPRLDFLDRYRGRHIDFVPSILAEPSLLCAVGRANS
jgi:hypothetical protein